MGFLAWICSSRGGGVGLRGLGLTVELEVSKIECPSLGLIPDRREGRAEGGRVTLASRHEGGQGALNRDERGRLTGGLGRGHVDCGFVVEVN